MLKRSIWLISIIPIFIILCTTGPEITNDSPFDFDTVAPVLKIVSDNPLILNTGDQFDEPQIIAIDAVDGDLSNKVEKSGDTLDLTLAGNYNLIYSVTDSAGNTAIDTLIVTVIGSTITKDTIAPEITIHTSNPLFLYIKGTFVDSVTALDNVDGDITDKIIKDGKVNTGTSGENKVTYTVTDLAGNSDTAILIVNVVDPNSTDSIPPVITISVNPDTISVGETTKSVVTANDDVDGDISSKLIKSGEVDNSKFGINVVYYSVFDLAGNGAYDTLIVVVKDSTDTTITDTTTTDTTTTDTTTTDTTITDTTNNSIDTIAPIIIIPNPNPINLKVGDTFTEPSVTATDETDGDISSKILKSGDTVNVNVVGAYNVIYSVSDLAGNESKDTLVVNITAEDFVDTIAPVITIAGKNPLFINLKESFTEPNVTAVDETDGDISAKIKSSGDSVDTEKPGNYIIIYSVSDVANNSVFDTLTVTVLQDTTRPVITVVGSKNISIDQGSTFSNPTVTAADNIDGDITASIKQTGSVNSDSAGVYNLIYTVSDAANNSDTETVIVTVVADEVPPVLVLKGFDTVDVYLGNPYTDSGATASDIVDGDLTSSIETTTDLDVNVAGAYTYKFTVSDAAGNSDTAVRYINVPNPLIVEDFESGEVDQIALKGIDESAGYWFSYTDAENPKDSSKIEPGADSVITDKILSTSANSGSYGMYAKYTLRGGDNPYAVVAFALAGDGEYVDLSKLKSFECYMKGSGSVRINFTTKMINDTIASNENIWGAFGKSITLSTGWTKVVVNIADLKLPVDADLYNKVGWSWSDANASNRVGTIEFEVTGNQKEIAKVVEMHLDDIKFNY